MFQMVRVGLRYCGSCNPDVDVAIVSANVRAWAAQQGVCLVPWRDGGFDALLLICGCSVACANDDQANVDGVPTVVVAGQSVDGAPTSEAKLAEAVTLLLGSLVQGTGPNSS